MLKQLEGDALADVPLPDAPLPVNPLKAGTDKLFALVLLALTAPLWIAILAATALVALLFPEDRGPLFFREERISQGRRFYVLKFRIVRQDVIEQAIGRSGVASIRYLQDDANCTRVGRWLKKFYLDELPQLLNILRGDICLVGPRPRIPAEYERDLAQGALARKYLRTGLTGIAQVNKARLDEVGFDTHCDTQYLRAVAHLSARRLFALDAEILARTLRMMLRGEGL